MKVFKKDIEVVSEFGEGTAVNTDYVNSRGDCLITNGTGLLGNNYNFEDFIYKKPLLVLRRSLTKTGMLSTSD